MRGEAGWKQAQRCNIAKGYYEWVEPQGFGYPLPEGAFLCDEHREMVESAEFTHNLRWVLPCGKCRLCDFCKEGTGFEI